MDEVGDAVSARDVTVGDVEDVARVDGLRLGAVVCSADWVGAIVTVAIVGAVGPPVWRISVSCSAKFSPLRRHPPLQV